MRIYRVVISRKTKTRKKKLLRNMYSQPYSSHYSLLKKYLDFNVGFKQISNQKSIVQKTRIITEKSKNPIPSDDIHSQNQTHFFKLYLFISLFTLTTHLAPNRTQAKHKFFTSTSLLICNLMHIIILYDYAYQRILLLIHKLMFKYSFFFIGQDLTVVRGIRSQHSLVRLRSIVYYFLHQKLFTNDQTINTYMIFFFKNK